MCVLPIDDLCIECSVFSIFFFQGQFKLSKYKNHIVKVHKLAIILFCMCVCVRNGWEASSWSFHLLTEGTSLSHVLPFALFPGGRILLDTLQHRGLYKVRNGRCDFVIDTRFFPWVSVGGVQPFILLCAVQTPLGPSVVLFAV